MAFFLDAAFSGSGTQLPKVKVNWSKMAKGREGGLHVRSTTVPSPETAQGRYRGDTLKRKEKRTSFLVL